MYKFYAFLLMITLGFAHIGKAQVFDPADPVVNYNPNNPPETPAWGEIAKWVRTLNTAINFTAKDSYKCYYLNGMAFRLKFPKTYQHGVSDGKKYPLIMFFHGRSSEHTIYDNEYMLSICGDRFAKVVDNGTFDGFILMPTTTTRFFGNQHFDAIKQVLDELAVNNKLDENRVFVNGLSAGGTSTWEFSLRYPKVVAGFLPMSAASLAYKEQIPSFKHIALWIFQGGLDNNPHPGTTDNVVNAIRDSGGNVKLTLYPTVGHGTWTNAWNDKDFWPFINRQNKTNPWPEAGHYEFCPGETVNTKLGLTPGFDGYEWRKDGVVIPGANANELLVTEYGTYDARIKRGDTWSPWSVKPIIVKEKLPTKTPPITIEGLMSKVIPAPDGKDYVTLGLPTDYTSYHWEKVGDTTTLGAARTLNINAPGQYHAKVTEQYGCSSEFSEPFTVIAANGPNPPSAASGLTATAISKVAVTLDWIDNPNAAYNETGYEIYRSGSSGENYELIHVTGADTTSYTDEGLAPNTKYFYIVRAVNNTAAAPVSNEASTQTQVDANPPTAPGDLTLTGTSHTSVSLSWDPADDDVGVYKYDLYVNGIKSFTVDAAETDFTIYNLNKDSLYTFIVKARDLAGNISPRSNQVSSKPKPSGLNYRVYNGTWNALPDFNTLTPVKTGNSATPDISVRARDDNFAILWEGMIRIPATGNYTFVTNSDDGSRLWLDTDYSYSATPVVDNDGSHTAQDREGTKYLTAGMHKIVIAYFNKTSSRTITVSWKNTAHGVGSSKQTISSAYYREELAAPNTGVPKAPGNILATALSYNKIQLNWADSSNNETGFEVYRANSLAGPYNIISTTKANITSYLDSGLVAQKTYYYRVQAINGAGSSGFDAAANGGLAYSVHAVPSSITQMPDFDTLLVVKAGIASNATLDVRDREDYFAIKFAGYINIPVAGNYTFYTTSNEGSKLYIGAFAESNLVVNNQSTSEKSGIRTLTAGRHPIYVTYFEKTGSQTLSLRYAGPGISKRIIADSSFANKNARATTLAQPPAPAAPTALALQATSPNSIALTWNDNSVDESGFEIFRSVNDSSAFRPYITIAANAAAQATFSDTGLLANVTYYYKVLAKNEGGKSAFSNSTGISTLNSLPEITRIANRSVRYGTELVLNVTATDADGDNITLTAANVPAFGQFSASGPSATFTFNPTQANEGMYDIIVIATDQHNGTDTTTFILIVSDNYAPVIEPVAAVSLLENARDTIDLTVTDNNSGDAVTWTAEGLPSFATLLPAGNTAQIILQPGYIDAGAYNVTLQADDGRGGISTQAFTITVTDVNPNQTVYVNFNGGEYPATAPWNNTNKQPALNDQFAGLKDQNGTATAIGIKILTNWQTLGNGSNYFGTSTNNNSGVYPDNVMKTAYWSNTTQQSFKLYGLNSTSKYSFTFFGARGSVSDNRMTNYTIGSTTVSLQTANNTQNTVAINNVSPDVSNEITIHLKNGTGSVYSYLNAMVVKVKYDDGNAPAAPANFALSASSEGVKLNWKDVAFNETAYEVYRATEAAGPFTLLNASPANADAVSYLDNTTQASHQYYYAIRAINEHGASAFTDTLGILTGNNNPKLDSLANVSMKNNETFTLNVTANDDAGDIITLKASGLPTFATFTDNGDGTGHINIHPSSGDVGRFSNIKVTATDNNGGSSTRTFSIVVRDRNITAVYVNFNQTLPADQPWNNFNSFPGNTAAIANLTDETGTATGIRIQLLDAFSGTNNMGTVTGNNSGVFPDNVIASTYYTNAATARRVRLTGLPAGYRYNLVFFGSRQGTANMNTDYTVDSTTVTLNAAGNNTKTVQINGVMPDSSGNIEFTVKQSTGADYGYINALLVQYYLDNGVPLSPGNATAQAKSKNSVQLTWMDNSNNENGFEVWRSTDNNNFSLVTTVGNNVNAYADNGLSTDTRYYYKVRAVKDSLQSEFSNVATTATFLTAVYVNFNVLNPAGVPWNNTNAAPFDGMSYPGLKDDNGTNSGINMEIRNFTGENPFGMNTGNNSGVYPDNVISSTYWVDIGEFAEVKLKGLNLSKKYNFVFFASRDGSGDRTTLYSIGNTSVSLNAGYNINRTVQINDVSPDENGEVLIKISAGGTSIYGYIGALVIQSYTPAGGELDPSLIMKRSSEQPIKTDYSTDLTISSVFPNPFVSQVTVDVISNGKPGNNLFITVADMSGKVVYSKALGNLPAGSHRQPINLGATIPGGIYVLTLRNGNQVIKSVKLVKGR